MDANKAKAHELALALLVHRLGRKLTPLDFITYTETILETTERIIDLMNQGIVVTVEMLIEALDDNDGTCGGGEGPPPSE